MDAPAGQNPSLTEKSHWFTQRQPIVFAPLAVYSLPFSCQGEIAQLVEQRTENPRVDGSIPSLATFLMFCFYILKSQRTGLSYKGHTQDLDTRLKQHNSGKTRSTKNGIPWQLIYRESFKTREKAIARERYFKSLEGGKELKSLLSWKSACPRFACPSVGQGFRVSPPSLCSISTF